VLARDIEYASGQNWRAVETAGGWKGWVDWQYLQPIKQLKRSEFKPWYADE
jgi:hypothetical protein